MDQMPAAAAGLMRWNGQEGKYLKYDFDLESNDRFVLNPAGAVAATLSSRGRASRRSDTG